MWLVTSTRYRILGRGERLGAQRTTSHMRQFNDIIQEFDLVDLLLKGVNFTWSNHQDHCSRLDQFCCLQIG